MSNTLYFTHKDNPNFLQIKVALKFARLQVAQQQINKKYDPLILVTPEGSLNQPIAIMQFLLNGQLSGQEERDKVRVWEWFEHFSLQLHPLLREIYDQMAGTRKVSREKYDYSLKELLRELQVLNSHLKLRTFMVGDSVTIIDVSLATHLEKAFSFVVNEEARKKLPNLMRWFTFVRSTGPFQEILGELKLCGKEGFILPEVQNQSQGEKKDDGKQV